jgi:hypothetical protein
VPFPLFTVAADVKDDIKHGAGITGKTTSAEPDFVCLDDFIGIATVISEPMAPRPKVRMAGRLARGSIILKLDITFSSLDNWSEEIIERWCGLLFC